MKLHIAILLFLWGTGCNGNSVHSKPLSTEDKQSKSSELVDQQPPPPVAVTAEPNDDSVVQKRKVHKPVVTPEIPAEILPSTNAQVNKVQATEGDLEDADSSNLHQSSEFDIHKHQIWDDILRKFVTVDGGVDYVGIRADRTKLDQYLMELANNPVNDSWSRSQKLAYWINAYNAFTVELIVNNYPVKSIRDIDRPWAKKFIRLGEKNYSLNQIEHDIIRPKFQEPRIHFAVVCAAVSCPKLLNQAYLPETLDQQLDAQTRSFINHDQRNQISENSVKLSQLFNWYGRDFQRHGTIIDFLNKYTEVSIADNAKTGFLKYDWSLNDLKSQ